MSTSVPSNMKIIYPELLASLTQLGLNHINPTCIHSACVFRPIKAAVAQRRLFWLWWRPWHRGLGLPHQTRLQYSLIHHK